MEATIKNFNGRQVTLETKTNQQIIVPIELIPEELTAGDTCYIHVDAPQDLEHKKIRKLSHLLQELIN